MIAECLNVDESIILGIDPVRNQYISNYIESIINLSKHGIKTICYHFRPLCEWVRTNVNYPYYDGSYTSMFNYIDFVIFELFIIEHPTATTRYDIDIQMEAKQKYDKMKSNKDEINVLMNSIILGLSYDGKKTLEVFKMKVNDKKYLNLTKDKLRNNLLYFLKRIIPICEQYGVKMALHPDEPPFDIFGIPRIISTTNDVQYVLKMVDSYYNGITLCVGTFSSRIDNNLIDIINICQDRIHYLHCFDEFVVFLSHSFQYYYFFHPLHFVDDPNLHGTS